MPTFAPSILFYRSSGSFFDKLIMIRTASVFCHAEVQINETEAIGAIPGAGVTRHPLRKLSKPTDSYPLAGVPPVQVAAALTWLHTQLGCTYGWCDIFNDSMPEWWPLLLVPKRAYDCSHLCAAFLIECGLAGLLGETIDRPAEITPGSLATLLGVKP